MAFNVPTSQVNIKPIQLPDNAKLLANVMRGLRQVRGGSGGTGGPVAGRGKGDWIAVPDAAQPQGYRLEWVPGGTKEVRENNLAVMQQAQVQRTLAADPIIQDKLAQLQGADVARQASILADIRRNDIARLTQATGSPPRELFDAMLGNVDNSIRERRAEVRNDSGLSAAWDSLRLGARGLTDTVASIAESPEERLARAEDYNRYRDEIIANNAYLEDQERRRAAGEGAFSRMFGDTGSITGSVGSAVAEMLPTAGAMIGAAALGTAVGGPIGGIVGGAASGVAAETQAFVNRVAADPNLSQEEKVRAIEDGLAGSAAVGAVTGAIPLNVGRVGSSIAQTATRAGLGSTGRAVQQAATREAGEEILRQAALDSTARAAARSLPNRALRATGLTAAELSAMNAASVVGQNATWNRVTGQDVPLTEGLGEALQQGLLAAPIFGAPRALSRRPAMPEGYDARGRRIDPNAVADTAQPPAAPQAPTGGATAPDLATQEFNRSFRAGLKERVTAGEKLNAQQIREAYLASGRTLEDYTTWLDADARLFPQARLGTGVVRQLRSALKAPAEAAVVDGQQVPLTIPTHPRITPEIDALYNAARTITRGDVDAAALVIGNARAMGIDLPTLERFLADSSRKRSELRSDPEALLTRPLNKSQRDMLARAIDDIRQEQAQQTGATDGGQNAVDGSSPESAVAVVGRDGQVREVAADTANNLSDSGVATDSGSPAATVANELARRDAGDSTRPLAGSDRAAESGGVSRTPEQNIGPAQTLDVPAEATGPGAAVRANAGRSAEAATAPDAAASSSAGEPVSEGVGTASRAGDATSPSTEQQSAGRGIDTPEAATSHREIEMFGRAAEEVGSLEMVPYEGINVQGETPLPQFDADGTIIRNSEPMQVTPEMRQTVRDLAKRHRRKAFMRRPDGKVPDMEQATGFFQRVVTKSALGEPLTAAEQNAQQILLRDSNIRDIIIPDYMQQEYADARAMGMDVTDPVQMVRAAADQEQTINKIVKRIWCTAL